MFLRLSPLGVMAVDAVNRANSISQDPPQIPNDDRVWHCLSEAFTHFLLGPSVGETSQAPKESKRLSENGDPADPQKLAKDESIPEIPYLDGLKKRRGRRSSSLEEVQRSSSSLDEQENSAATPVIDDSQAKEDGDLELKVLDCLTDEILTACGTAGQRAIDSLIHVVEEGISRPLKYQILQNVTHSNFSLVCIRKMYVLCSRGSNVISNGDLSLGNTELEIHAQVAQVRNHVAKCALPRFLKICHDMINRFAEESQYTPLGDLHVERPKLEEIICILEVLATMTLSPDVVDSMVPENDPMGDYIKCMRKRPEVISRGKERTHLLFLYDSLCSLITCRDSRIRDMVRDVLVLAGAELGISMTALSVF